MSQAQRRTKVASHRGTRAVLVVISFGSAAALLRVGASFEQLSAPPVDVVGTIGAGGAGTLMAGLLAAAVRTQ